MKYLKDNEKLFLSYLYIIISNIILYIFCNFYLKSLESKDLVLMILVAIIDYIILIKTKVKFKVYFDLLVNLIVGLILMIFIKEDMLYAYVIFSIFLGNNIVFTKSRLSKNFWLRSLQYILSFIYTILIMFINLILFNL